jgi:hypothetical protein
MIGIRKIRRNLQSELAAIKEAEDTTYVSTLGMASAEVLEI